MIREIYVCDICGTQQPAPVPTPSLPHPLSVSVYSWTGANEIRVAAVYNNGFYKIEEEHVCPNCHQAIGDAIGEAIKQRCVEAAE